MKLLFIAENWPPRIGGIETYLRNLVGGLREQSITVLAPPATTGSPALYENDITVIRSRFFWPIVKPAWLPLFWYVQRLVRKEQIEVVLCGKALFEGLIGYTLKKALDIPYVVFTYAMEIETWASSPRTNKKLLRVLQSADRVVYINDVTKSKLQVLGVPDTQLMQIQPGVTKRFFEARRDEAVLQKYGIDHPYILTVARLIERKGVDDLITAFASLEAAVRDRLQFVIAGDGPEREALEDFARRLLGDQAGRRVVFAGHVPDDHLPALYASATLFALTPKPVGLDIEGFGIVYLEAAAAGVPSLATTTGGAAEAVVHNQTGIVVEPGDSKAIREALMRLLSDQALLKVLGHQAKDRAAREFSWLYQAKKLDDTLTNIFNKGNQM